MKKQTPKFPPYVSTTEKLWHYTHRYYCIAILVFLLLPILVIMPLSFSESSLLLYPIQTFSLKWYHALFHSDAWIRAAKNSFIVAPSATLIAPVLGTLAAAGLHRTHFPGKTLQTAVLIHPLTAPFAHGKTSVGE